VRFLFHALIRPGWDPQGAAEALLDALYDRWLRELMPRYRAQAATDPTAPRGW
jgi:hypothetical protein